MFVGAIAAIHANADLLVGLLLGVALGLLAGPVLRAWLTYLEWTETSREAELTEELIDRFDRDLDELSEESPQDGGTWRTSR